jgi:hypothetical protein
MPVMFEKAFFTLYPRVEHTFGLFDGNDDHEDKSWFRCSHWFGASLTGAQHRVLYIPSLTLDKARDSYRGVLKTDARGVRMLVDQACMRLDIGEL